VIEKESPVATSIIFAAGDGNGAVGLLVAESPADIFQAITTASGLPFPLTRRKDDARVYVNPTTIAYWVERLN
jgi:hypothetical protein